MVKLVSSNKNYVFPRRRAEEIFLEIKDA